MKPLTQKQLTNDLRMLIAKGFVVAVYDPFIQAYRYSPTVKSYRPRPRAWGPASVPSVTSCSKSKSEP